MKKTSLQFQGRRIRILPLAASKTIKIKVRSTPIQLKTHLTTQLPPQLPPITIPNKGPRSNSSQKNVLPNKYFQKLQPIASKHSRFPKCPFIESMDDLMRTKQEAIELEGPLHPNNKFSSMKNLSSHSQSPLRIPNVLQIQNQIDQIDEQDGSELDLIEQGLTIISQKSSMRIVNLQFLSKCTKNSQKQSTFIKTNQVQPIIRMGPFIGSGSFAQVFLAMNEDTGEFYACKKMRKDMVDLVQMMVTNKTQFIQLQKTELNILQRLDHKNIVKYVHHTLSKDYLQIYQEYICQGNQNINNNLQGNLHNIIQAFGPLSDSMIKLYSRQMLEALSYLHKKNIVHLDIKSSNILIDTNGVLKLGDFGCSKQLEKSLLESMQYELERIKGSIPWMAPEVINQSKSRRYADIWSFGCTVLEMINGKTPWFSQINFDNPLTALYQIATTEETPFIPTNIDADLQQFLCSCLQRDPAKRSHAETLLKHKYLN